MGEETVEVLHTRIRRTSRRLSARQWRAQAQGSSDRSSPPSVSAIIVTHNSSDHIQACLRQVGIALEGVPHRVIVVDNASTDATSDILHRLRGVVTVHRMARNAGFAAAVNRGAHGCDADYILIVNPDARIDRRVVEVLLSAARQFPAAGLYGGQAELPTGTPDPFSRLPAPSLRSAVAFALGVPALRFRLAKRGRTARDHDVDRVRRAYALCGAVLLIDTVVWRELGGFDEQFVMYGEDVDFCQRARMRGYLPLQATAARYIHVGGVSFSAVERWVLLLRANSTLLRRHVPGWRGQAAVAALTVGAALRAGAASTVPSREVAHWRTVWAKRREWQAGWPEESPVTWRQDL